MARPLALEQSKGSNAADTYCLSNGCYNITVTEGFGLVKSLGTSLEHSEALSRWSQ